VSANLARDVQPKEALKPGSLGVVSLIASVICQYDSVLRGMVGAGLGIQAICEYLGLACETLDHNLVRLGLKRPHDRPLRRAGRKAWTAPDVMRLILYRMAGIHPAYIAAKLDRSVSGVYAKLRRLGIPAPPRSALRRVEPPTLRESDLSFGFPARHNNLDASDDKSDVVIVPDFELRPDPKPASSSRKTPAKKAASAGRTLSASKTHGQRELRLLRNLPNAEPAVVIPAGIPLTEVEAKPETETPVPAARTETPAAWVNMTFEQKPVAYMSDDALAVRLKQRFVVRDPSAILNLSIRIFGGWSYKAAAQRLGTTASKIGSLLDIIDLPRSPDRSFKSDSYDLDCGIVAYKLSGFVLRRCQQYPDRPSDQQALFWKGKTAAKRLSRKARMKDGPQNEHGRYAAPEIQLIRKSDLHRQILKLSPNDRPATIIPTISVSRSQPPLQGSLQVKQGGSHEERQRGSDTPSVRSGLSGHSGQQMPWAYAGHGRAVGGVARP